jgi:hypothetical protein
VLGIWADLGFSSNEYLHLRSGKVFLGHWFGVAYMYSHVLATLSHAAEFILGWHTFCEYTHPSLDSTSIA